MPNSPTKAVLLESGDLERVLTRMAHEIVEKCHAPEGYCLVGIKTRGEVLAKRLAEKIAGFDPKAAPPQVGALDVTFYRDDSASRQKLAAPSELPFSVEGKTVVLVDDVLYTGRTVRAALTALLDYGRAGRVRLACLVDRGLRELPIRADVVGKNVPTSGREKVRVQLKETDGVDQVDILAGGAA